MCLAVPGRLIEKGEPSSHSIRGRIAYGSTERPVELIMVPEATPGDYLLVHSGYAIEVISEQRARETLNLLGQGFVQ